MKKRIFAAVLASAMVLSLAACGKSGGSSSSNLGNNSSVSSSQLDASQPDASQPDASNPDGSLSGSASGGASSSDGSLPNGSSSGSTSGGGSSSVNASLTLNRTDVTMKTAGSTFKLRYTAEPSGVEAFFSSSDEKIATVDGNGNVTAVAPGTATITVTLGDELAQATCIVRCKWDETSSGGSSSSGSSNSSGSSSSSSVSLSDFYTTITGKYEFGFLELADSTVLELLYSGMSSVELEQNQIYYCMMSMNNGEFAMVQVKDSKDVDTVKAAFQARIDYMVGDGNGPGGAQYPMAMDQWENNSRVVSNGNYVMMVVHESCDDIVKEFNALF